MFIRFRIALSNASAHFKLQKPYEVFYTVEFQY